MNVSCEKYLFHDFRSIFWINNFNIKDDFHLELDEYSMNKYLCKAHKWNSGNNVAQKKVTVIFSINIIPFSLMFPHYSDGWFKLKLISWFPFKYQHLLNVNIKQTKMYKNIVNEPYLYSRCGKIPRKNIFFHVKKFVSWFYYFNFLNLNISQYSNLNSALLDNVVTIHRQISFIMIRNCY